MGRNLLIAAGVIVGLGLIGYALARRRRGRNRPVGEPKHPKLKSERLYADEHPHGELPEPDLSRETRTVVPPSRTIGTKGGRRLREEDMPRPTRVIDNTHYKGKHYPGLGEYPGYGVGYFSGGYFTPMDMLLWDQILNSTAHNLVPPGHDLDYHRIDGDNGLGAESGHGDSGRYDSQQVWHDSDGPTNPVFNEPSTTEAPAPKPTRPADPEPTRYEAPAPEPARYEAPTQSYDSGPTSSPDPGPSGTD